MEKLEICLTLPSESNGYKPELTIDRIDNDKGYSPDNCRWITRAENSRNQSNTKLDWDKVNYIRNSGEDREKLADKFNVGKHTIDNVRKYRTWNKT